MSALFARFSRNLAYFETCVTREPKMLESCLTTQFVAKNVNKNCQKNSEPKGIFFTLYDVKNARKSIKSPKNCSPPQGCQKSKFLKFVLKFYNNMLFSNI